MLTVSILFVVVFFGYLYKTNALSRKFERTLKSIVKDEVRSIALPDGLGGWIEIERLLLTDYGLIVIQTYSMNGYLYGAEHIDNWTQIIDGGSFKFVNPGHHLQHVKNAVQHLTPEVPVFGRIIFTGEGSFPKGMPEGVSVITTLEQDLHGMLKSAAVNIDESRLAWDRILDAACELDQIAEKSDSDDA